MGSFQQGLNFGKGLYLDAEQSRRQDEYDRQRKAAADYLEEQRQLERGIRADDAFNARRGLTGITPNMTSAPGGMGPVASPDDVDWRYNSQNLRAVPYTPPSSDTTTDVGSNYPSYNVADASGGLPSVMFNGVPANTAPALPPADTTLAAGPSRMPGDGRARPPVVPAVGTKPGKGTATGVSLPSANDGGMTEDEQTNRIAASQLKRGDYQGFYGSQDRAKSQKLDADHSAYMKSLVEMPSDEFGKYLKDHVTDNPKIKTKLKYDPKTERITLTDDDGTEHEMTRTQGMIYLSGAWLVGNGKVDAGLERMQKVNEQRQAQQREGVIDSDRQLGVMANQNLNVDAARRADDLARAKIELERQQGNRMAKIAEKAAKDHWVGGYVDAQGNQVLYNQVDGTTKPLPAGVRAMRDPANDVATRDQIDKRAKFYVENGALNESGPNKGKKMTAKEALAQAEEDYPNAPMGRKPEGLTPEQANAGVDHLTAIKNARAEADRAVPPAPPQMIGEGGVRQLNPEWVAWMRRYNGDDTLEGGRTPATAITRPPLAPDDLARIKRSGYQ